MITVEGSQNLEAIEGTLSLLAKMDRVRDLQLATNIRDWRIGGKASLIQFLISWAKNVPDCRVIMHVQQDENPFKQIARLIEKDFGLVAALMADDVMDKARSRSLRLDVFEVARKRVEKMTSDLAAAARGPKVFLLSVDHSTLWKLHAFYYPDGSVRSSEDFVDLVSKILKRIVPRHQRKHIHLGIQKRLGQILHELVNNTHEWARTDVKGTRLVRSVRGVIVEAHNNTIDELLKIARGSPQLEDYLSFPGFQTSNQRRSFLEISVFDSGPGLAARWLGPEQWNRNLTLEEELEACVSCLTKHKTSAPILHRGVGLYHVVRTLSPLQGFMRIRSGHLSLYRDFTQSPSIDDSNNEVAALLDWKTRTTELTPMAPAEGLLYTMLIPLLRYQG